MKEKEKCTFNPNQKTPSSDMILFFEPLAISTDNLVENTNIQLDSDEFIKGLKDASYISGMYTGLLNVGISVEDAIEIILGKMNIEHNIELSKINANASIESAKNATLVKEKDML